MAKAKQAPKPEAEQAPKSNVTRITEGDLFKALQGDDKAAALALLEEYRKIHEAVGLKLSKFWNDQLQALRQAS